MSPLPCPTCAASRERLSTMALVVNALRTRLRAKGCPGAHRCATLEQLVLAWDTERARVEYLERRLAERAP